MALPRPVRWVLFGVAGLGAVLLLILAVVSLVRIPIDLTEHKGVVEAVAGRALGRRVIIDEKIAITTSVWPAFEIEGLRIGNPAGFQGEEFARMKTAKLRVALWPLLLSKIRIHNFSVEGLAVTLEQNKEGKINWAFRSPGKPFRKDAEEAGPAPEKGRMELSSDSLVLHKLLFKDITVSYRGAAMPKPFEFAIDECTGSGLVGKPFVLFMKGSLRKEPFTSAIKAASLEEFLKENKTWMKINTDIAQTRFELEGVLDLSETHRSLDVKASVQGDRLDSLNGLFNLDLPPLKSHGATAKLRVSEDGVGLSNYEVRVGKSKLVGEMKIDTQGPHPEVTMDFTARTIQLNDFDVGNWSARSGQAEPEGAKQPDQDFVELLSPEVLAGFSARLKVQAEEVVSGKDRLGSGVLKVMLKEGRLIIDPLKLNLPGGSLMFSISLKPGSKASKASVRTLVKNFDIGVPARRADPNTDMGGTISLDADLTSSAGTFDELLANANGYLDFQGRPQNLRAGILDLWAVNLLDALVTASYSKDDEKSSKINCVIGRWAMKDGVLKPDTFVIDTSKIRICGKGQVDFKKKTIQLTVAPVPKKPQFFSLATPLGVQGKFSDFSVGILPGGIFGTAVKYITSPLHVPLRQLAGQGLPEDGSDMCSMAIGPENRSRSLPPGCSWLEQQTK